MNNRWSFIRSFVCFFIFLELFFWIGSWVTQTTQFWGNTFLSHKKDVYKIMCIGDSTTYAGGNDSYPSQLKRFLNANTSGRKFQVLNQGMAGASSTTILSHLDQWLETYQPDMVVAMVGFDESDDSSTAKYSKQNSLFLKKSKVYQLFL